MIGNPAITLGVMAIFLALCDGAVLPEFRPDREIECHCYNNAATASMIRPVCGTDGRTYQNMCVFVCFQKEYEDLDLKHNGECVENYETYEESEEITEDCYCTKEINPVCGTDNKTYKNTCYLNCRASDTKDLKLKQHGSCEDLQPSEASDHTLIDCPCTREINPVCGSDAKTYPNFCILNCHSHYFKDLKLKHHGECENNSGKEIPKLEVEDCFCSKEINHVCGTDSKTYQNLCMLNCRSRDTKDLKVKHHGACKSSELGSTKPKTKNECFCSKEINHVCGTDSKTYQNLCILNCHSRDTKDLKLKHDGECDNNSEKEISKLEVEDCFCSKEVNHVCGTDSKTYQNLCMLNCRSRDTKDLKVKHHGVCNNSGEGSSRRKTSNDCFCSKEINHVCGTDSKTYQNLCILNCHSRDTKDLKLKHHGECENNSGKEISKLEVEDCFCSKEINHVCGTDSKTYQNLCMLNCRSRDTKDLKVKHHGICESYGVGSTKDKTANDCFCSKEINHVCGTDSKTYQNLCILNCHSRDTKDLKLSHLGHCDEE